MKIVLNGHSFYLNAGVSKGSILGPMFFLFFFLRGVINSRLGIYTDGTAIYSILNGKSDRFDKVKLLTDP